MRVMQSARDWASGKYSRKGRVSEMDGGGIMKNSFFSCCTCACLMSPPSDLSCGLEENPWDRHHASPNFLLVMTRCAAPSSSPKTNLRQALIISVHHLALGYTVIISSLSVYVQCA